MRWSIQTKLIVGFGTALLILSIIATLTYLSTSWLIDDGGGVAHTFQILAELEVLRSRIADAEAGQRGFLITGDESFLAPFRLARPHLRMHLARLRELTRDNARHRKLLDRLEVQLAERFDTMRRTIEIRNTEGREAALHRVTHGPGQEQMDAIRGTILLMEAEEDRILNLRVEDKKKSTINTFAAVTLLIVLDFALLGSLFLVVRRDLAERKQAERQLSEQNRLLEEAARSEREAHGALRLTQGRLVEAEKLASLGLIVAGVAHEINNPLAFVISNVAVLEREVAEVRQLIALLDEADDVVARERPELHDRIREFREHVEMAYTLENIEGVIERSRDGLRRIHQIVKDLRNFARLDDGKLTEVDLNVGIESTVTIIRGHARKKHLRLELDLGPLPAVSCNPAKINQVVMNLLSNAIDASHEEARVIIRTRGEASGVRIEVIDEGSGIAPEFLGRIFDPLFTTKPVGQGTGLGLSISSGIIQDHGGTIEVDSTPGKGTRFAVLLPLTRPTAEPPPTVSRLDPEADLTPCKEVPAG